MAAAQKVREVGRGEDQIGAVQVHRMDRTRGRSPETGVRRVLGVLFSQRARVCDSGDGMR